MAMEIQHELIELKSAAGNMATVIRSLENVNNTLSGIRDRTRPVWAGDAAEQFSANTESLKTMVTDYVEDLNHSRTTLEEAVAAYEKTEGTVSKTVGQLRTEGIF